MAGLALQKFFSVPEQPLLQAKKTEQNVGERRQNASVEVSVLSSQQAKTTTKVTKEGRKRSDRASPVAL